MDISERIKKLREAFGITSNELANITGIHPVSIRKYETKKMVPGIEVIDKMCAALKLPRTIFEGIPEQYINYDFIGDFYQTVLLLMASGAIEAKGTPVDDSDKDLHLTLNIKLSQYIEIRNGDESIPLDQISIHIKEDSILSQHALALFETYLLDLSAASIALSAEEWDKEEEGETKEDYASRMIELAEDTKLKLMLEGHSWKQYMAGMKDTDEQNKDLALCILAGGNAYDFIRNADMPDSEKQKCIVAYEEAYLDKILKPAYIESHGDYPKDKSKEEQYQWVTELRKIIDQYKIDHPSYKDDAKQHAIKNAELARESYTKNHKE